MILYTTNHTRSEYETNSAAQAELFSFSPCLFMLFLVRDWQVWSFTVPATLVADNPAPAAFADGAGRLLRRLKSPGR